MPGTHSLPVCFAQTDNHIYVPSSWRPFINKFVVFPAKHKQFCTSTQEEDTSPRNEKHTPTHLHSYNCLIAV